MNQSEIYSALLKFYNGANEQVQEYMGIIELQMLSRVKEAEITIEEVHAALNYKINKQNIRQIDPWTIIITADE